MKDINEKETIKSNRLINEYHNTINSNFKKNPNFKYKLDLIKFDDLPYNIKKTFDIFTSHYDNKVYMAYSDDYKITIFDLLERKKIKELNIKYNTYIKYFINQNNFKEYLLLGYRTELLDINNNYNIIYQNNEDSYYKDEEYSMLFPENTNNEYIIKSKYRRYGRETSSSKTVSPHLYSLNEKKFQQIFYNYYQNDDYGESGVDIGSIGHLLVWHNEKNNNYYILQFAKRIIISNIFKNEPAYNLCYEAKNGFIYNKADNKQKNSYLCIATNYSIDIIDLYDKECIKSIQRNFKNCLLIHQWSNKYVIAIDGYSWKKEKILTIIDLENNKVITKIEEEHTNKIMYIKKIYHPIYGESLLTGQENGTIKLWVI